MLDMQSLGSVAGWQRLAVDAVWQSTLVGLAALAVMRLLRLRPATRAAVALTATVLCVATPLASAIVRTAGWGFLSEPVVANERLSRLSTAQPKAAAVRAGEVSSDADRALDPSPASSEAGAAATAWNILGAAWLLASVGMLVRLARSAAAVRRLCRTAAPCNDGRMQAALARAAAALGVQLPQLCTSAALESPALVTWGRSRLLLPEGIGPRDDWFAVFCHELAHLVRRDGRSRLTVELAVVVLPWQPLLWLVRREFRTACEEACDDWAVATGADPVEFAALLVDFIPQAGSVLVLGMSESVPAARNRILRLLAMQGVPRPGLRLWAGIAGWIVAIALGVTLALLQYGRPTDGPTDLPPWGDAPASVAAAKSLPPSERPPLKPYRVEPPDILLIDAVKVVPKPPYRIEPLDTVQIFVLGTLPSQNIAGPYPVEADGTIALGAAYGTIKVSDMSLGEAKDAILEHLRKILTSPEASISLAESAGQQQIEGEHLIGPDGTVNLGTYGSVFVSGMTVEEVRKAVEKHLETFLDKPEVSVDVFAYNSKVYYVITERDGGDEITRVPCTGHERVLDALTQVNNLKLSPGAWVWVARPTESGASQIMPVDWRSIFRGESSATNYWIEPGDRIFVSEKGAPDRAAMRSIPPFVPAPRVEDQDIRRQTAFPHGEVGARC